MKAATVSISGRELLTIKVRLPRLFSLRFKLTVCLFRLAGAVSPVPVTIETENGDRP